MEQTLEEAAEILCLNIDRPIFKQGAKWQQEQDKNKYSEEDIYSLLDFIRNNAVETDEGWQMNKIVYTNEELFEKFKNK